MCFQCLKRVYFLKFKGNKIIIIIIIIIVIKKLKKVMKKFNFDLFNKNICFFEL